MPATEDNIKDFANMLEQAYNSKGTNGESSHTASIVTHHNVDYFQVKL